jgi:hypothetical protein
MTHDERRRRRLAEAGPLFTLSQDEILADLAWPGPPPGRWLVDREPRTEHIDTLLEDIELAA